MGTGGQGVQARGESGALVPSRPSHSGMYKTEGSEGSVPQGTVPAEEKGEGKDTLQPLQPEQKKKVETLGSHRRGKGQGRGGQGKKEDWDRCGRPVLHFVIRA